jgi:N-acetylmuramate 1-kinase
MLAEKELLELTNRLLPDWPEVARVEPILKGGSDRCFYRLHFVEQQQAPVILMTYTMARPDNPRFVSATARLEQLGVRVPHIYFHDTDNLCVWLEDLGNVDLHTHRKADWSVREPLYQAALSEVAHLHAVDADALPAEQLAEMELCFDEKLYEWEQNYFLTHFVQGFLGKAGLGAADSAPTKALLELRQRLAMLPRGLVHRDFQSQNVLIRDQAAWLIDYQGVRPGLAEYDLASLLLDPYVDLSDSEREALLRWYAAHTGRDFATLHETYLLCAAQRLMQALGAYANLSRNLNKPHFQEHIPVAVARLRAVCARHPLLVSLPGLMEK